ncbi:MAG TPA: site-2 protease family protein, partial [Streptosporangiaceae bacterium]
MRIARPFGIPVFISPYWFLIAGLFVFLYARSLVQSVPETLRYPVAAAFVVLLYASVLVHELSHSLVARGFGLPVRRILLYPLGGFSEIEREPPTPGREFLVSAAGPAISLALAAGGYALTRAVPEGTVLRVLLAQLVFANLLVGIFNLLPGLPLDGGRMLRAGVWKLTGRAGQATVVAAWAGRVLALAVLVVPFALAARTGSSLQLFD